MKKCLFLFLAVLSFNVYSQNASFGIRSIEQNNGFSTTFSNYYEFGLNFGLGITTQYKRHLFQLKADIGGEFEFLSSAVNQFYTINLLYGREFPIRNWLILEGLIGAGYIQFDKESIDTDWIRQTNKALNFPISLKVLFVNGKVFSMGINPNINLNSFQVLYSTNLIFQFKFRD